MFWGCPAWHVLNLELPAAGQPQGTIYGY